MTADTKPPTLTDEEFKRLWKAHKCDSMCCFHRDVTDAAFAKGLAAGAEAQRKADIAAIDRQWPKARGLFAIAKAAIEAEEEKP